VNAVTVTLAVLVVRAMDAVELYSGSRPEVTPTITHRPYMLGDISGSALA